MTKCDCLLASSRLARLNFPCNVLICCSLVEIDVDDVSSDRTIRRRPVGSKNDTKASPENVRTRTRTLLWPRWNEIKPRVDPMCSSCALSLREPMVVEISSDGGQPATVGGRCAALDRYVVRKALHHVLARATKIARGRRA